MSLATVHSRALDGLAAAPVTVEVHLANWLPSFTVVGLADTEVKETRERVRAALANSGLGFPANKRIQCSQALFSESVSGRSQREIAEHLEASSVVNATRCPRTCRARSARPFP